LFKSAKLIPGTTNMIDLAPSIKTGAQPLGRTRSTGFFQVGVQGRRGRGIVFKRVEGLTFWRAGGVPRPASRMREHASAAHV
jgi:hypothetical protein